MQRAYANRLSRHPMEDSSTLLRKIINQRKLKPWPLSQGAKIPHFQMRQFLANRGPGLRLEVADRLSRYLTGLPVARLSEWKEAA